MWKPSYRPTVRRKLRPQGRKIIINLSNLDQIRQDALITRDSLLTEEELGETVVNDREKQPVNEPDKRRRRRRRCGRRKKTLILRMQAMCRYHWMSRIGRYLWRLSTGGR